MLWILKYIEISELQESKRLEQYGKATEVNKEGNELSIK